MELKEAKKAYYELKNLNKNVIANIDTEFFLEFAETVLQALDNSISRDKIKRKIKEREDCLINCDTYSSYSEADVVNNEIDALKELLGDDK